MKLNFKGKEVLVIDDFIPGEERRQGLVITSVTKEDEYQTKKVLYVGEEVKKFSVGDNIFFKRALAEAVVIAGEKLLMLNEGHIYCTITE